MMKDIYIDDKYMLNNAQEAKEYYFECMKKKINSKVKQACEMGERTTEIKLVPKCMHEELVNMGYKVIGTPEHTIISW